jgi:hypothetical protein
MEEDLTLQNICGGEIAKKFDSIIPVLMSAIQKGQKGGISITIALSRPEDMDTMVVAECSVTPKFPVSKRKGLCTLTGDMKLKTEKPREALKAVDLFQAVPKELTGTENGGAK